MSHFLDSTATSTCLPPRALALAIETLLGDADVQVPERQVLALPGGGSLFVMPAHDRALAITKLITFTPANAGSARPAIQGDVVVFDVATGERVLVLDGPTTTARRTAAVSLLAAQRLAPNVRGPLLIVGAGAQGRAHLEAFRDGLSVDEVVIASRTREGAGLLASHARSIGMRASTVDDLDTAMASCPLVVTCTPASGIVLRAPARPDAFVAAIGAFTPAMVELSPEICRHFAATGSVVLDTPDAVHEAGDLIQAGLAVGTFGTLRDVVTGRVARKPGPVLFKSCGWAGWDLAAARCAVAARTSQGRREAAA